MKKMAKRILSYIIATVTAICCIIYTNTQTANAITFDIIMNISADKEVVNSGDIITVSVMIKHFQSTIYDDVNPLISGIQVEIPIDTDTYEFIDFVNTAEDNDDVPLFINTGSSQSANYDNISKSVKCVGLDSEKPYIEGEATNILVMKFKLRAKKATDVHFVLGKTIFDNMLYKNGKENLQYSVIQFFSASKYGDVNNDGFVNVSDAVILKKVLSGMGINYHFWNSDVNNDYQVNSSDVVLLLKHLAGMM